MLWVLFNQDGQVLYRTNSGNLPFAGTTDYQIYAVFQGIDISHYGSASIKFYKPDFDESSYYPLLLEKKAGGMVYDGESSNTCPFENGKSYPGWLFDFTEYDGELAVESLLDTAGMWRAVITLFNAIDTSLRDVEGSVMFEVGEGNEEIDDPTAIEIDNLLTVIYAQMGQYLLMKSPDYIKTVSSIDNYDSDYFNVGDLIIDRSTRYFYQVNRNKIPERIDLGGEGISISDVDINKKFISVVENISELDLTDYESGKLFYDKETKKFYEKQGTEDSTPVPINLKDKTFDMNFDSFDENGEYELTEEENSIFLKCDIIHLRDFRRNSNFYLLKSNSVTFVRPQRQHIELFYQASKGNSYYKITYNNGTLTLELLNDLNYVEIRLQGYADSEGVFDEQQLEILKKPNACIKVSHSANDNYDIFVQYGYDLQADLITFVNFDFAEENQNLWLVYSFVIEVDRSTGDWSYRSRGEDVGFYTANYIANTYQPKLTFDSTPTAGSNNPVTSSGVKNYVDTVDNKLDVNVHIEGNADEITYNVDRVTKTSPFKNLKTGATGSRIEVIHLANSTTAGMMSHTDWNQIQNNTARIAALEGQTVRLLYTTSQSPTQAQIQDFVDDYLEGKGITNPQPSDYVGVAVVVAGTYHIWHYYENNNIGWRDDGLDTVTQFTNDIAGIIKGKQADGFVFAENDGTGSVYGWSVLKTTVSNIENNYVTTNTPQTITGLKTFGQNGIRVLANDSYPDGDYLYIKEDYSVHGFTIGVKDGQNLYNVFEIDDTGRGVSFGADNFTPGADNAMNLGYVASGVTSRWKDLYLAGNISDGTDSVSVANIVTKNTAQTITGKKTFSNGIVVDSLEGDNDYSYLSYNQYQTYIRNNNTILLETNDYGTLSMTYDDQNYVGNLSGNFYKYDFSFENHFIISNRDSVGSGHEPCYIEIYDDEINISSDIGINVLNSNIYPAADSENKNQNLGYEHGRWNNLYLKGVLSDGTVSLAVANIENKTNKVTSISSSSTDTQYPSAKAVHTALETKVDKINAVTLVGAARDPQTNTYHISQETFDYIFNHRGVGLVVGDYIYYKTWSNDGTTYKAISLSNQDSYPNATYNAIRTIELNTNDFDSTNQWYEIDSHIRYATTLSSNAPLRSGIHYAIGSSINNAQATPSWYNPFDANLDYADGTTLTSTQVLGFILSTSGMPFQNAGKIYNPVSNYKFSSVYYSEEENCPYISILELEPTLQNGAITGGIIHINEHKLDLDSKQDLMTAITTSEWETMIGD